jgi:glycosyltransferase involved in cell wall biosynthesis
MAVPDNPSILFASYHCPLDPSSGAALATRDLLGLLAERRWRARVFCGPTLDFERPEDLERVLVEQGAEVERRDCGSGGAAGALLHFRLGPILGAAYVPQGGGRRPPTPDEGRLFLTLLRRYVARERPAVALTYGGGWIARESMRALRAARAPIVFALHNTAYRDRSLFDPADAVLVPSRFCAEHYRRTLGLDCECLPSPIDWRRVEVPPASGQPSPANLPRYVTFVNPQPAKGAFVFARIALELGRRRPDILLLVVEGRGRAADWLGRAKLDLSRLRNLHRMASTPDPRDFYRVSRLMLMPSLERESFGRVAVEAMLNGVPVLATDRGALPEVLGDAGHVLEIPAHHTPRSPQAPTAAEVEPWVERVIGLWDDPALWLGASLAARRRAGAFHPDPVAAAHDALVRRVAGGPGRS